MAVYDNLIRQYLNKLSQDSVDRLNRALQINPSVFESKI